MADVALKDAVVIRYYIINGQSVFCNDGFLLIHSQIAHSLMTRNK